MKLFHLFLLLFIYSNLLHLPLERLLNALLMAASTHLILLNERMSE